MLVNWKSVGYRADQLRREVAQLTTDNKELTTQVDTLQGRLMELSIELGQLRDDVSRLQTQLKQEDQTNGKHHKPCD